MTLDVRITWQLFHGFQYLLPEYQTNNRKTETLAPRKPADPHTPLTVKKSTFELLRSFGIGRVFGNPGSTELPFLSDWPEDIDYVLGLQEATVVGMADGYAQITRNAGFVSLHSAAGVGNALGNIYTAYRNQTPLVITAGQQARSMLPLQPFLYAERASEFPRPYVKYSVEPARAQDVPAAIARAYYVAMCPPCGPTFVSIPIDDWERTTDGVSARHISREFEPETGLIKFLANAIARSKSPALVLGPAVDRANAVDLAVKIAERMKAPVWVSPFSARCSFPEQHPLFAGFLHASPAQLSDALRDHDLVVVVGAPVFTFHVEGHASIFDGETEIFQITDDPAAASIAPVGTSIIATMIPALKMLLANLPEPARNSPLGRQLPDKPRGSDPIPVEFLMHVLSLTLPADAALVEEVPSCRPTMQKFLPMRGQDSFFTMSSGGLGWALPASVGISLGSQSRRTVCLIGDGSAMYSLQALWTAAERKLPLTIVVVNNSGYGAMRAFSQIMQVRNVPGLDLPGIDFVRIAEGMGCFAARVERADDLASVLTHSFNTPGCSVIDVAVDSQVQTLYNPKV